MRLENHLEAEIKLVHPLKIGAKNYDSVIVREVSGFDEEEVSQAKFKNNMPAIYIEIIYRCIAEVPGSDRLPSRAELKELPAGILDTLLLAIRELSAGEEMHLMGKCPNKECQKEFDQVILTGEVIFREGSYAHRTVELSRGVTVDGKKLTKATIKIPTGGTQEVILKHKSLDEFGSIKTDLINQLIVDIDGQKISREEVVSLSNRDRKLILDSIKDSPGPLTMFDITCGHCGEMFKANLNLLDFLV